MELGGLMDKETRRKYHLLKEKNKEKNKITNLNNNMLFNECIDLLNEHDVLTFKKTDVLFGHLNHNFPMTNYGCINWKGVHDKKMIYISDISDMFDEDDEIYILWDQQNIPCVRCKLSTVLENIDDVLAVSFNTWLLSINYKEVIEFHHEGRVTYGKVE